MRTGAMAMCQMGFAFAHTGLPRHLSCLDNCWIMSCASSISPELAPLYVYHGFHCNIPTHSNNCHNSAMTSHADHLLAHIQDSSIMHFTWLSLTATLPTKASICLTLIILTESVDGTSSSSTPHHHRIVTASSQHHHRTISTTTIATRLMHLLLTLSIAES